VSDVVRYLKFHVMVLWVLTPCSDVVGYLEGTNRGLLGCDAVL
jgi:hypothetical protein